MFGLHVIELPNGRFGYVGDVPREIAFTAKDGGTADFAEIQKACSFGARFGNVKSRSFDSREDAVTFAHAHGYEVVRRRNG